MNSWELEGVPVSQITRRLAAFCAAALFVAGCTKPPAPVSAPAVPVPAVAPASEAAPASDLRKQALALMAKSDLPGAIARWQELTAKEPSADNWNDLSYAQLLAGQYKDAIASAQQALKLDPQHAAAQYNLGMAYLESGDPKSAEYHLDKSAKAQPDRFEPLIGLARSALAQNDAVRANRYLIMAQQLPGAAAEVARLQPAVEKVLPPSEAADCAAQLHDGPVNLCLKTTTNQAALYLLADSGPAQRIVVDMANFPELQKGALPDGNVVYWLKTHTAVVDVYAWQAFVVRDGKLQQLLFRGGTDLLMSDPSRFVKSYAMPRVVGSELEASHRHEADPSKSVTMRFRFGPDGLNAEQTFFDEHPRGK